MRTYARYRPVVAAVLVALMVATPVYAQDWEAMRQQQALEMERQEQRFEQLERDMHRRHVENQLQNLQWQMDAQRWQRQMDDIHPMPQPFPLIPPPRIR